MVAKAAAALTAEATVQKVNPQAAKMLTTAVNHHREASQKKILIKTATSNFNLLINKHF